MSVSQALLAFKAQIMECEDLVTASESHMGVVDYEPGLRVIHGLNAAVKRLSPTGSPYPYELGMYMRADQPTQKVREILAIARALLNDYDSGSLQSVSSLVRADVFADFAEMAEHLLEEGYKDPAAVIIGSVLEEHLRKLAILRTIDPTFVDAKGRTQPKKADVLNSELAAATAYDKTEQKQVTAWLGLRNDAAHGHYDRYNDEQVRLMIAGVIGFLTRHPA